jgi:hypothetical protein
LDELENITGRFAAETMVKAAVFVDVEAGALFLVEGAEARETSTFSLELDRLADDVGQVGLIANPVDCLLRDHEELEYPIRPLGEVATLL